MGRLRHDEDFEFLSGITEEVADLFGTDAFLYRYLEAEAENTAVRDPLYDEPASPHTVQRKRFQIKMMWFQLTEDTKHSDMGSNFEITATAHISLAHLVGSGVNRDKYGDYVQEGDIIEVHPTKWNVMYFDVVNTTKAGFANDSHLFTGYNLNLKRNSTFNPQRNEVVL